MKIPIKKHTKVRRPISRWVLDGDKKCIWYKDTFDIFNNAHKLQGRRSPVQDISKGLENPLITGVYEHAKPSLLTRVKERFGRDK